ncbi:MAG: glycoside hydrolase domain-containing protein [Gemmatimonadota bacterium]
MSALTGQLAAENRGFDCNQSLTADAAARFAAAGYRFVIRYVRRTTAHPFDISADELQTLHAAGLAVMLVQHVAAPGWEPTAALGSEYGATAAAEAAAAGYPEGASLWCDLEGVATNAPAEDVVAFCNAWYDATNQAGFRPGLYVGDCCGLTPSQLYEELQFSSFWSAYNLNLDNFPAVRGVQMRQSAYPPPERRVEGISFEYDEDVLELDSKGDMCTLALPPAAVA